MKTKDEYIKELAKGIRGLPEKERNEVLADYEEHFQMARESGKKEEEICKSLGTPKSVAHAILMNTWVSEAESSPAVIRRSGALLQIMLLVLILAPFNFFMLLCPFLILFVLVVVGWTFPLVAGGLAIAGFTAFWQNPGVPVDILNGMSMLFMFLGTLGIAVLAALLMFLITKGSLQILFSYFKWNIDFITSRRAPMAAATARGTL